MEILAAVEVCFDIAKPQANFLYMYSIRESAGFRGSREIRELAYFDNSDVHDVRVNAKLYLQLFKVIFIPIFYRIRRNV